MISFQPFSSAYWLVEGIEAFPGRDIKTGGLIQDDIYQDICWMIGTDELVAKTSGGTVSLRPERSLPAHVALVPDGNAAPEGEPLLLSSSRRLNRIVTGR
jgi:hypothetical protein